MNLVAERLLSEMPSIWRVAIILGPIIEPYVQPSDAGTGGAEPNRFGAESPLHCRADLRPKRVFLRIWRLSHKYPKMAVSGNRTAWTRHDHDRVFAEIRKLDDISGRRASEVLGKCVNLWFPRQTGTVEQNKFK